MDDSNIHIVKRTDQWKERAVQSYVVPRGVLCVELTPDGNTRIKIGEGNKYYSQLPYIGANIDISKYFTKEEVKKLVEDTSEATVIAYMDKQPYVRVLGPILPSAASLPKSGNKDGDIRFVKMAKVTPDGKAYIEYVWFNNRWDPLSSAIDIDVSKFATKEELAAVQKTANELAKRVTLLEQAKHIHLNKSIIDSITAPFTTELAAKLSGIEPNANKYVLPIATRHSLGGIIIGEGLLIDSNGRVSVDTSGIIVPPYDDTEVKRRITNLENVAHTHANKAILDATTASYTTAEKSKLAGLENYDDTALSGRVTTLEESSHTHTNKSVLDNTTASYTTEEQTKLAGLENYTLPTASSNTLGGVKIGDGLSIDQDGILSTDGGIVYRAGAGISIETASGGDPSIYDTTHPYYSDTQTSAILDCPGRRRTYTRTTTNPAYVVISRVKNTGGSPYYWYTVYVISKNINDTLCNFLDSDHFSGRSSTADAVSVTIDGTTWYGNGYMISLGDIDPVGDVNEVVPYFESEETSATDTVAAILDYIYSDDTSKYIVNTGVLDVTKNASGNLVVSKESGDTTITLPQEYTLPIASANDLGGVKVGSGLEIDQNGVLSATGGGGTEYVAGDGINIRTESTSGDYDTSSEYYFIDETVICNASREFTLTSERAALPKYGFVAINYLNQNWCGPILISKDPEAVRYNASSYTSSALSFTYNDETWYRSDNGYWNQRSGPSSSNVPTMDCTNVDDNNVVAFICSFLDTLHPSGTVTQNIIENTGVLDVTKDNNGDLVVSTINGDTTLQLDHYTLPTASSNALGGIKVGANLSIDQDGVLSATGGGTEYLAGEGISITERSEEHNTPVDISSEHWVNESPTGGGSRYTISTNRTYLLQRYSLAAGTSFKVKFVPTNPTDIIYYGFDSYPSNSDGSGGIVVIGQTGPVDGFEVDQSRTYTMPADRNSLDVYIRINDTIWSSSDVVSAASFTELKLIITESVSQGTFIDANVRDGLTIDSSDNTINVTPATTQTIGGVIIGDGISIDENGVISVSGGEYIAGDGISIVTGGQIVTDLSSANWGNYADMYDGQRSPTYDSRTFKLRYLHIEPGTQFKINLIPTNPNDTIYWYLYGYDNDAATTGGLHFGQSSDPNDWDTDGDYTYTMPAGKSSLDITVRINNPGYQQGDEVTLSKFDEMQYITGSGPSTKSINVTPATSRDIGGVIIGSGINVDQNGVISVNSSTEYVAGDGISIDQGSTESSDITELQWEQGSINPVNGEPDDLTMTVIRSPMIEVGLTNMLNVSAQDTSDNDMRWEAAFYDSNSEFISMETTWQTLSDEVVRPDSAKYVVILLRKETETEIDENALKACEISWPIEIGKYVVTNTGVTHVGLTDDGSVIYVENGSTNTLLTFGQDLDVTNGVVSIPDYHRLVLNVEE